MLECQVRARELKNRLRNPTNAVHDDGIDLKRKKNGKAAPIVGPGLIEIIAPIPGQPVPPVTDQEIEAIEATLCRLLAQVAELRKILGFRPVSLISAETIKRAVAAHFNIKVAYMLANRRHVEVTWPRQIAMYLTCQLTPLSLPQIGRVFGGRDHTTILHAREKITMLVEHDAAIAATIQKLSTDIVAGTTHQSTELSAPVNVSGK